VLGIGVLIPLAYFDNSVDAFMRSALCVHRLLLSARSPRSSLPMPSLSGHLLWLAGSGLEGNLNLTFAARNAWPHAAAYRTESISHSAPCANDHHPWSLWTAWRNCQRRSSCGPLISRRWQPWYTCWPRLGSWRSAARRSPWPRRALSRSLCSRAICASANFR
jgi:hypothetical protein